MSDLIDRQAIDEGATIQTLACEHDGASPEVIEDEQGVNGWTTRIKCPDCGRTGKVVYVIGVGEETVHGPFEASDPLPDSFDEFVDRGQATADVMPWLVLIVCVMVLGMFLFGALAACTAQPPAVPGVIG